MMPRFQLQYQIFCFTILSFFSFVVWIFAHLSIVAILKLQVQDSDLEYLIWQFDKRIILYEKKPPLDFSIVKKFILDFTKANCS